MPSLASKLNGFAVNTKCDKNNSFGQSGSDPNTSAFDDSLESNSMELNHL